MGAIANAKQQQAESAGIKLLIEHLAALKFLRIRKVVQEFLLQIGVVCLPLYAQIVVARDREKQYFPAKLIEPQRKIVPLPLFEAVVHKIAGVQYAQYVAALQIVGNPCAGAFKTLGRVIGELLCVRHPQQ